MISFHLNHEMFRRAERTLLQWEGFEVSAFCYESGIEALRIRNKQGELVVLPYQGQQIWEAVFQGVSLKNARHAQGACSHA